MYQVNGAPASEGSGGGEEEAGASYVELGQGGQEVLFVIATNRETCVNVSIFRFKQPT